MKTTLFILMVLVLASSCEQIKPIVDRERQELTQNTQKQEDILAPLAGRYEGVLHKVDGKPDAQVRLVLVPNTIIVQNPGRNDITLYPTLGGTLSVVDQPSREGDEVSVIPVATYEMAKYDQDKGTLKLTGSVAMMVGSSQTSVRVYLDGTYNGGRIQGHAYSSLKGDLGQIEVDRVAN